MSRTGDAVIDALNAEIDSMSDKQLAGELRACQESPLTGMFRELYRSEAEPNSVLSHPSTPPTPEHHPHTENAAEVK